MGLGQRPQRICPKCRKQIWPVPQTWIHLLLASKGLPLFPVRAQLHVAHLLGSQQAWRPREPGKGLTQGNDGQIVRGPTLGGSLFLRQTRQQLRLWYGGLGRTGPSTHPSSFSPSPCSPLGHGPVVLGTEEPAGGAEGAGRLGPPVHESAQLWCSCQWDTTQRLLQWREGGLRDQRIWPHTLEPPLTSSVTSGKPLDFSEPQCPPL